ncbi:S1 domain-containing RNA-binding protein [Levilactobacillus fujinensis]|uniref:S1 domain-containing RNA-binding protein n=1 Tax=Levilactobacillus fujinensis TaxID=2486024 RepID=A0ABW1TEH6_9LACO|nr:S1 domain-containing RNA-binding protein [Levilactobacillus fujinensis]
MAIEVGAKVSGKVSGITNFGAFVDLGDHKTGLVHISEISDGYVKDIHDVLSVGDEVTVKVLTVGNDGKIGLSIRKATDHPASERPHSHNEHRDNNHEGNNHGGSHDFHGNGGNHNSGENHGSHGRRFEGNGGNSNGPRPHRSSANGRFSGHHAAQHEESFDDLMSGFLKQSEDRLATIKRNTEGKRGGRGGRRS